MADTAPSVRLSLGDVLKRLVLAQAVTSQRHYPCRCHDWVLRRTGWELVKRP